MKKPSLFRLAPSVRVMLERLAEARYTTLTGAVVEAIVQMYKAEFPEETRKRRVRPSPSSE